jgi:hypothetical protein
MGIISSVANVAKRFIDGWQLHWISYKLVLHKKNVNYYGQLRFYSTILWSKNYWEIMAIKKEKDQLEELSAENLWVYFLAIDKW